MTNIPTCIICLDTPQIENPLYLLACGCKIGWFHDECKNNWLTHAGQQSVTLHCPACRQLVSLKTNYCFDWRAGPEQNYLAYTLLLYIGEWVLSTSLWYSGAEYAYILGLQSTLILCLPFMFYTNKNIFFYLNHIRGRSVYICLYILINILFFNRYIHTDPQKTFFHLSVPGGFQTLLLLLTHCQREVIRVPTDPLFPFAISREVLLASKCSALSAERLEG
jgi:hypothetical protein